MTLLADLNHSGSKEDSVSNWEPAHSLVEDAVFEAEIASCLPALAVACLPLCLWQGAGLVRSQLSLLCYLLNPLFCEQARLCLRLEVFTGKSSIFFSLSLWLSHSLHCYLTLAPSDCPQGTQAHPCPKHATCVSLFSPHSLVVDPSIWTASPQGVAVICIFCGFFFFFLVMLPSKIPKLPTDLPMRGLPGVWKLLHDSLPRMGLHP